MVWYSHLFQNFPQFIVIHPVKGFGIVNEAEIDVFLELSDLTLFKIFRFPSAVFIVLFLIVSIDSPTPGCHRSPLLPACHTVSLWEGVEVHITLNLLSSSKRLIIKNYYFSYPVVSFGNILKWSDVTTKARGTPW